MYNPGAFAETDVNVLRDAVRRMGAGQLITYGSEGLEATVVPLLIADDARSVTGHLARANRQWARADLAVPALITWRGPEAYISPSYYPSKLEHGEVVPTWNYITVQARGRLVVHHDEAWKRQLVTSLTRHHERRFARPWVPDDAPPDCLDRMLRAIVGFEVEVSSLEGKWKLSQNRPAADVAGVVAGLSRAAPGSDDRRVAEAMESLPPPER
jgi:transcriptional regulator